MPEALDLAQWPSPRLCEVTRTPITPAFAPLQAYAISVIASFDWPEQWPTLFDELMAGIRSQDAAIVHGVMRVLTGEAAKGEEAKTKKAGPAEHRCCTSIYSLPLPQDFIGEVDNAQLPVVVPLCLPELHRIVVEEDVR